MSSQTQLGLLRKSVKAWNQWRGENPKERVDLSHADLAGAELRGANLREACLRGANLRKADLTGLWAERVDLAGADLADANLTDAELLSADLDSADFRGANLEHATLDEADLLLADLRNARLGNSSLMDTRLIGADLTGTDLRGANLDGANLTQASLAGANLKGARLTHSILVDTNIDEATFDACTVYGMSAWDLKGTPSGQSDLTITDVLDPPVTVDDLEVAQFVYLLLNNKKILNVLTTIGRKGVLILGRFSAERKTVLDAIRSRLRQLDYVPMMFDFERADDRSFTETVRVLAGLSCFIIADITNPKSAPLELQATVPDYMVPFVPILAQGEQPFSMLGDLQRQYDWVMPVKTYRSVDQLLARLEVEIVRPALQLHAQLQLRKAKGLLVETLDDV